jgi:type II secretory pathway component PulF
MLATGWALSRSLEMLSKQTSDRRIAAVLPIIVADIQKGAAIGDAFLQRRSVLGPLFCRVMGFYDAASGTFAGLLSHLADYYEKNEAFRDRVIQTIKYPALITIGSVGIILVMLVYFVPSMLNKISTTSSNLPPLSNWIFHAVRWIASHPQVEIGLFAALMLSATLAWYLNSMLKPIGNLLNAIPLLSDLARKEWLRRFSLALAALLSGGIALPQALSVAAETIKGTPLYREILPIESLSPVTVAKLAAELQTSANYSGLIFDFLNDVQTRHNDADLCRKIGEFYQEEIETSLTAASLIIEPVIIVVAGLFGVAILLTLSHLVG